MKLAITILFSLTTLLLTAQEKKKLRDEIFSESIPWHEGSMMLSDGTELKGLLKYNDKTGILNYQNGNDSRSLLPRSLVAFEYYDEAIARQRVFYSLEEKDPEAEVKRFYIFEVMKEFRDFAVLSKSERLEIRQKQNPGWVDANNVTTQSVRIEYEQTETIYFMTREGKLQPYLQIVEKDIDDGWFDWSRTKNKFVKEEAFAEFTGSAWQKLVEFASEKKLSFKRKKDILQVLAYYETIVSD